MTEKIKAEEVKEILSNEFPKVNIMLSYKPKQDYKGSIIFKNSRIVINCLNEDLYNRVKDFIVNRGWVLLVGNKALSNSPFGVNLQERSHIIILKGIE